MKKRVLIISSLILLAWLISFLWFYFFNKEYFVKKDLDNYMNNLISHNCENIDKEFFCEKYSQSLSYKISAISFNQDKVYVTVIINQVIYSSLSEKLYEKYDIPYNLIMERKLFNYKIIKVESWINKLTLLPANIIALKLMDIEKEWWKEAVIKYVEENLIWKIWDKKIDNIIDNLLKFEEQQKKETSN